MMLELDLLWKVIITGIIILLCFLLLRFIKDLFSISFVGFVLSLISYFVYDFKFATVPVIAAVSLALSLTGLPSKSILRKIFSIFGILISLYIILSNYGIINF